MRIKQRIWIRWAVVFVITFSNHAAATHINASDHDEEQTAEVTNDKHKILKVKQAVAQLFYPVTFDLEENNIIKLEQTKAYFHNALNDVQDNKLKTQNVSLKGLKDGFDESIKIIDDLFMKRNHSPQPHNERFYQNSADLLKSTISKCEFVSVENFYELITNFNDTFQITFKSNIDESLMLRQLKKISMHLFFPLILNVDEDQAIKLQTNKEKFQDLIHDQKNKTQFRNLILNQSKEEQDISWKNFICEFDSIIKLINEPLEDIKIKSRITYPLYAENLKLLSKLDISHISLSNFFHFIIKFDNISRKAFFTKPYEDGKLSCESCHEQTVSYTKCLSQPVLECSFCGHEQFY